jgi:proton-coupled amino acid transporter
VPLVYIYPAFLHFKGVAETRGEKTLDIAMMVLGIVAMGYTTRVTVAQWVT